MYKKIILLLLFCVCFSAFAINSNNIYSNVGKYKTEDISSDYSDIFKDENDKTDFKKLREYLTRKEDLIITLNQELQKYQDLSHSAKAIDEGITALKNLIKDKNEDDKVKIEAELIYELSAVEYANYRKNRKINSLSYELEDLYYARPDDGMPVDYSSLTKPVSFVELIITDLEKEKEKIDNINATHHQLIKNVKLIQQDIYDCTAQINSALAPEYKQQEFRITMSITFAVLIGALLVVFFTIVYLKSDNNLSKELLSGNGLQFVTLFVLIIAVILFGILGILQGSELAAILSGISGYILGKGVKPAKSETPPVIPPGS